VRALVVVALAACGRIDFDPVGSDAPPAGALRWVTNVIEAQAPANLTVSFQLQAQAAGDAILLHVGCDAALTATGVSASAPGWTFTQLGPLAGMSMKWGALFVAIAPDTAPATLAITWDTNCSAINTLADEFTNADPTAPFEAFDVTAGIADCTGTVTTVSAGDAMWAACSTGGTAKQTGPGYTKIGDDAHDDWSEYKLTADPAGTVEQPTFVSVTGGINVMTAVAIKPR
jgi:hypothetical protein